MSEVLSDAAKEARRAYHRSWYKQNKEKAKERQRRYWERKAAAAGRDTDSESVDGRLCVPNTERAAMDLKSRKSV